MRKSKIIIMTFVGLLVLMGIASGAMWFFKPWSFPIEVTEPGKDGVRITENGLIANYFPGKGEGPRPAILLLGGSEGGITENSNKRARHLQEAGYSVLYPGYYRTSEENKDLNLVPLEIFDTALAWMKARKDIDGERIGIIGGSKGAEAALLIASTNPGIKAVIAAMPSNVVWQGFSFDSFDMSQFKSSWSRDGKAIAYLPYAEFDWGKSIGSMYSKSLLSLDKYPDAVIKVEQSQAVILLICGEEDTLWPSCEMARAVEKRAKLLGRPPVSLLAYADAGHGVFGTARDPKEEGFEKLGSMGGSPEGNNSARKDGWPKAMAFLAVHLKDAK